MASLHLLALSMMFCSLYSVFLKYAEWFNGLQAKYASSYMYDQRHRSHRKQELKYCPCKIGILVKCTVQINDYV